ncbi:MAG: DUF5678 domain-containing protein [Anaerolineae bacterium]
MAVEIHKLREEEKPSQEYIEDQQWALENYGDLCGKYPDKWIAIVDKKVVAAGDNIEKIRAEAFQKTGREDVPVIFVEGTVRVL